MCRIWRQKSAKLSSGGQDLPPFCRSDSQSSWCALVCACPLGAPAGGLRSRGIAASARASCCVPPLLGTLHRGFPNGIRPAFGRVPAKCRTSVSHRSSHVDEMAAALSQLLSPPVQGPSVCPGARALRLSAGNYYRQVSGVGSGGFGGSCTCPDGRSYAVGDNNNACGSLACEGGLSGPCEQTADSGRVGMKVTCAAGTLCWVGMTHSSYGDFPGRALCTRSAVCRNDLGRGGLQTHPCLDMHCSI